MSDSTTSVCIGSDELCTQRLVQIVPALFQELAERDVARKPDRDEHVVGPPGRSHNLGLVDLVGGRRLEDRAYVKKHFGRLLVTDVRAQDIADYITARRLQKASDKTIRNEIGSLRSILKRDRIWAHLKDEGVTLPKVTTDDAGVALTQKEEAALLAACTAIRSRSLLVVVTLALSTGLRLDELRLLRWNQIDFVNRALRVRKSKTESGAGRAVPLNQRALATMKRWAKEFPDRKPTDCVFPSEQVGFSGDDEVPDVFDTDPTKPISTWKTAWTTARTAADVHCRFHDLRHTVVTRLLEAGQGRDEEVTSQVTSQLSDLQDEIREMASGKWLLGLDSNQQPSG